MNNHCSTAVLICTDALLKKMKLNFARNLKSITDHKDERFEVGIISER